MSIRSADSKFSTSARVRAPVPVPASRLDAVLRAGHVSQCSDASAGIVKTGTNEDLRLLFQIMEPMAITPSTITIPSKSVGSLVVEPEPSVLADMPEIRNPPDPLTDDTIVGAVQFVLTRNDAPAYFHPSHGPIALWDTSEVTDMSHLFLEAKNFNGDISRWNTSNVTNMQGMFNYAEEFDANLALWDTTNVRNMSSMFLKAKNFNRDISRWSTSKVTDMRRMFWHATEFNGDVKWWDTSRVTDMSLMFAGAKKFEFIGLHRWDTSSVGEKGFFKLLDAATLADRDQSALFSALFSGHEPYSKQELAHLSRARAWIRAWIREKLPAYPWPTALPPNVPTMAEALRATVKERGDLRVDGGAASQPTVEPIGDVVV